LEVLERLKKAEGLGRLAERLPDRLKPYANLARLRSAPPHATIPLDLAEEFILAIEGILGDGSGQLLEKISNELRHPVRCPAGRPAHSPALSLPSLLGTSP
jgi:hypothetical protein